MKVAQPKKSRLGHGDDEEPLAKHVTLSGSHARTAVGDGFDEGSLFSLAQSPQTLRLITRRELVPRGPSPARIGQISKTSAAASQAYKPHIRRRGDNRSLERSKYVGSHDSRHRQYTRARKRAERDPQLQTHEPVGVLQSATGSGCESKAARCQYRLLLVCRYARSRDGSEIFGRTRGDFCSDERGETARAKYRA